MTNVNDIIVAVIVVLGPILAGLIHIRRKDRAEHAENGAKLDGISYTLGKVEQKLDDHIDHHGRTP